MHQNPKLRNKFQMRINGLCTECVSFNERSHSKMKIYSFYRTDKIDAKSISHIDPTPSHHYFDLSNLLQSLLLSIYFDAIPQSSKFEH